MDTTAFATRARRALAALTVPLWLLLTPAVAHAQTVTFGGGASTSGTAEGNAAATTPAAAAAPDATPASPNDEWAERDRALGESSTLGGGVGLLRTQHAQGGAPGQFRLGFTTEYFSAGFLCSSGQFACPPTTPGGTAITTDSLDHIGGTLTLSATITKWLEGYATTGAYANSDSANKPSLLQVLGDSSLGFKVFGGLGKVFYVGGGADLWLINGTGSVGLDGSGTSAKFRAIATTDLRGMQSHTPLRFSINAIYSVDNTGDVVGPTEAARGAAAGLSSVHITRIERFGLGINRVDHFDINLGGEFFAVEERIRPFVEYSVMVPVNRQNFLCSTDPKVNVSNDKCLATDSLAPMKLTIGGRFFPWKKGFSLLAAFDIGLAGMSDFIEEVSPTPPWTLYLGAGWAVDTWDRPPTVISKNVEKIVEKGVGPRGHIKGFVHEKDKTDGVANAIVGWDNHPEVTALATGADGRFTTQDLADGPYKFVIHADGFKDGACETQVKGTADVQLDCPLEALPKVGTVVGHVRDATTQAAVPNANIQLTDGAGKDLRLTSDNDGAFRFENVSPGTASASVDAANYLALVETLNVKVRTENPLELRVTPKPKNPLVTIGANEITIKQQIQFALDSAVILPESNGLMTEIADTLIKNPRITRVEVQGHTDNSGTPEHNKILSDQRANAVRDWLTSHGVPPDRLIAKGYGQDKPVVPNVTPAMKARNRRVQFIILEQTRPTPKPALPNF
jgi:outer membrane protein OmpA-like peptidoglycan-associated protein